MVCWHAYFHSFLPAVGCPHSQWVLDTFNCCYLQRVHLSICTFLTFISFFFTLRKCNAFRPGFQCHWLLLIYSVSIGNNKIVFGSRFLTTSLFCSLLTSILIKALGETTYIFKHYIQYFSIPVKHTQCRAKMCKHIMNRQQGTMGQREIWIELHLNSISWENTQHDSHLLSSRPPQ